MDEKYLKFYAMKINGHTASLHVTAEEALEEIEMRLETDDSDEYAIERIDGIWELIQRFGEFEGYSDDWMQEVLEVTKSMVEERKKADADVNPNLPDRQLGHK